MSVDPSSKFRVKKPQKILVLGSGALQIGQAGEFDYSGSQALKAFKEEGIATVLINPNIATIQTDKGLADAVYFLPVRPDFVEEVIVKEGCDAIALSFGGQTALNCGLALEQSGALERLGVQVLGTPVSSIRDTEDRALFNQRLSEINVEVARSRAVNSVEAALLAAEEIGYPVMIRAGFALGGKGSKIVDDPDSAREVAEVALSAAPQILVEECLSGWKEIEYEVVRDISGNCITVCNMENVDPMGIHTGESIVVAPSQTLDDYEYQMLRDIAIKTIRHLGIVGECNIQYTLDPMSRRYRVIEVNARLSRSSALASKATGYPLAYVAAKLALGFTLPELQNSVTKVTKAFFEPALDYVVCKIPRWDLDKFENSEKRIGSEMKSIGEIMAVGRTFSEALQKGLRMIDVGATGFDPHHNSFENIEEVLEFPTPRRIFAIAAAFYQGMTLDRIHQLSRIDKFFLGEMQDIVLRWKRLEAKKMIQEIPASEMREMKRYGFADKTLAKIFKVPESEFRLYRQSLGVRPKLSQIDTLAAEYPAETNFLYLTYNADAHDVEFTAKPKVFVLGSGCYRIGSSVEFDWCAVTAVKAARSLGYESILLNCNPETVSTDYDVTERLVFDEISVENIVEIQEMEKSHGIFVSMGGQTPNNLVMDLHRAGLPILGTSPENIDRAENRQKFSQMLDQIDVDQPNWAEARGMDDIEETVKILGGYPVLVRPSYVLSGAAMKVAYSREELRLFLEKAVGISGDYPVVVTKFEEGAIEIEFDGVADQGELLNWAICEHLENAGVHSGDATLSIPPISLSKRVQDEVVMIAKKMALALNVRGPFNIQLLYKNNLLQVIECNLRASRSFPFVSKAIGHNFIESAVACMLGKRSPSAIGAPPVLDYFGVKAPQFSFSRIKGADPRLGVEMASTGEVACFATDFEEALIKAMLSSGFVLPKKGVYFSVDVEGENYDFFSQAKVLLSLGLRVYASPSLAKNWSDRGLQCISVKSMLELSTLFKAHAFDLVMAISGPPCVSQNPRGFYARRLAVDLGVSLITDASVAKHFTRSFEKYQNKKLSIQPWSWYLDRLGVVNSDLEACT